MANESYLIVSYFALFALALGGSVATWLLLRRSFRGIVDAACRGGLARLLRGSFPLGMILLAVGSCLSVNYLTARGCGYRPYEDVVVDHDWMVHRNIEQAEKSLDGLLLATILWDVVTVLVLVLPRVPQPGTAQTSGKNTSLPPPED